MGGNCHNAIISPVMTDMTNPDKIGKFINCTSNSSPILRRDVLHQFLGEKQHFHTQHHSFQAFTLGSDGLVFEPVLRSRSWFKVTTISTSNFTKSWNSKLDLKYPQLMLKEVIRTGNAFTHNSILLACLTKTTTIQVVFELSRNIQGIHLLVLVQTRFDAKSQWGDWQHRIKSIFEGWRTQFYQIDHSLLSGVTESISYVCYMIGSSISTTRMIASPKRHQSYKRGIGSVLGYTTKGSLVNKGRKFL